MAKPILTAVLCLVLATYLGATHVAMAVNELDITGTVKGHRNDPKQFASVQLEGPRRYVAMTNAEGQFTIQKVEPGQYTVRIRQGDYIATFSREIKNNTLDLVVRW